MQERAQLSDPTRTTVRMNRVAMVMARQFGVVTRAQAVEAGLGRGAIARRLSSLEWLPIHAGVYRAATAPPTWRQNAAAALLAAGEGAALSHFSAAYVLGLATLNERAPSVIDVTVPRRRRMELAGVRAHRSRDQVTAFKLRDGLRVTTLARTFIDLAGVLDEERLEFALDSAAVKYPRLLPWLAAEVESLNSRGRAGLRRLATLLELRRDGATDSPLEVKTWRALRRAGLVPVRRQFEVPGVMRVDFAWPERKVALHVDSAAWHSQSQRLTRDAIQRNQLQALGWYSSVVTHAMLQRDDWLEPLRAALKVRAPQQLLDLGCIGLP